MWRQCLRGTGFADCQGCSENACWQDNRKKRKKTSNGGRIMKNMTVAKQLATLAGVFLAGFIVAGIVAFMTLAELRVNGPVYNRIVQQKDLIADILPPPEYLIEAYLVALKMLEADGETLQALMEKSVKLRQEYATRHEFWLKELDAGAIKDLMVKTSYQPGLAFLDLRDQEYIPALQRGDRAAAQASLARLEQLYQQHRDAIDQLVSLATTQAAQEEQDATQLIQARNALLAAIGVGLAALVSLFSWRVGRGVLQRLGGEPVDVVEMVQRLAKGDLTQDISPRDGDRDSILAAIAEMQRQLQDIIRRIRDASAQVASAATQMSSTAGKVEATAHQEVMAATAMASAVEELSSSIDQITEHASQARDVSVQSDQHSAQGGDVIQQVVRDMQDIADTVLDSAKAIHSLGEQSEQIFSIVKVIKDIAEQTNLLALNAAIEAARAGEQGRGFAVVADEVRGLAARTAASIQEITRIVENIQAGMKSAVGSMDTAVNRVNSGVALANKGGDSIGQIKSSAQHVVRVVEGISDALKEESLASSDLSANVEKIVQMTETNQTAIEETAATARELAKLADFLQNAVAKFRLRAA
jgi:methyl-accepting chemotaxis protein